MKRGGRWAAQERVKHRRRRCRAMFPSPRIYTAERESTLREFIAGLGKEVLYAYDQRVVVVLVNGERRWPSSRIKPGDRIAVLPIIAGG